MTEKELLKVARRAIIIARKVRDARIAVDDIVNQNSENTLASASKALSAVNSMKGMLSRYGVYVPEVLTSNDIADIFCAIFSDRHNVTNIFKKIGMSEQED